MAPVDVARFITNTCDDFLANDPNTTRWGELEIRLVSWFAELDPSVAFFGALTVLEVSNVYQHQLMVGKLLVHRRLQLPLALSEFVRRIAPNLNASASSVGHYVKQQFGGEAALRELHALRQDEGDQHVVAAIDRLQYWMGQHPLSA